MARFIKSFEQVGIGDIALVGGKNASLGEMTRQLQKKGIRVPGGFAITADAYVHLLKNGGIFEQLQKALDGLDTGDTELLSVRANQARSIIKQAGLPEDLRSEIVDAYRQLEKHYGQNCDVAVRSSATAEDLPDASFAGQQESFLNVRGETALLEACLNCFASLFTDRAISYRVDKGFKHMDVYLSIGVQKMVRSDLSASGVIFTLDPESGFRNVVLVTSAYGLGENVVAGRVDPDEFLVFKPTLKTHQKAIIRHKVGAKQFRMIYSGHGSRTTKNIEPPAEEREKLSITDEEVLELANWACLIEEHYSSLHGKATAMDIEWAKDGLDGKMYIVQARPETVHSIDTGNVLKTYRLKSQGKRVLSGRAIGEKIGAGKARVICSLNQLSEFKEGDVLVADMTDPDWEPIMKKASGIVTNRGGRTCHAAIVSREIGVPCVVGCGNATELLKTGNEITVCCAEGANGFVYEGILPFEELSLAMDKVPETKTKIMVNVGNPEHAFSLSSLPVAGVGLAREEFIIANDLKVHPLALTRFDELNDQAAKEQIARMTKHWPNKEDYFVEKLAEGVAMIAAAFYPRDVIVRLSDFKTNEYANLLGGKQFEAVEDNPMIGFRGASRYYNERYRDGFALECRALKKAREEMGLSNIKIMVPFCRTIGEGKAVLAELSANGLRQKENGLEIYIMCELPSNVLSVDAFAELFDGFSIGSNDLTQLILGVDRDSEIVAAEFDERDPAVISAISRAITGARKAGRKIGICGQAPSDYPEFVRFLIEQGIDSISLNEDAVFKTIANVFAVEHSADGSADKQMAAV